MNRLALHTCMWGLALMLPASLCAQEKDSLGLSATKENTLKVDLQILTHGEIRNGGMAPTADDNKSQFLMNRERLVIGFERPGLETKLNIQHSGIWGQSGKGSFNVFEAWARMKAKNGLFVQVGRVASGLRRRAYHRHQRLGHGFALSRRHPCRLRGQGS